MRKVMRAILVLLAIIFLIEAWLWDKLEPVVARIVALIPLVRLKTTFASWAAQLPPTGTLLLFLIPQALLIPIKLLEVWLFVNGDWIQGVAILLFAKLFFLGTTAFVFDVTRDKLLQLDWFRGLYLYVLWLRESANALVRPIMLRIRRRMRILAPRRTPRAFKLLLRFRRRAQISPPSGWREAS